MKFEHAQMLWLLVVIIPPLSWFLYWSWRKKQALMAAFVQTRLLSRLLMGFSATRQKVRLGLILAAAVSAILAMARPQWGYGWEEAKQRGLDIMVAIDTSRSMLAEDLKPNRLERAKLAALDLRRLARNDRLGLVAFAGSAFLQCPLTLDDEAFRQSVGALDVGIIPQGGTALAEAIQTAVKSYKDDEDNHKVLILITDGEDHEEGAIAAAKEAAKQGMRIFTIGLGSPDGDFIRVPGEEGKNNFLRDSEGNVVKSRLDETLLQQIAGAAEGFYLNLRGINTMETLYDRGLAPLPKTEISAKLVRRYHERFYIPLALAMLCLLAEIFMPDRARKAELAATKAAAPAAATAVLLLAFAMGASASPATAMREYQSGNYDQARKEYEQLIERRPEDARLQFNAGSAAYKGKKYEEAARSFSAALTAPDLTLQQRAFYNLGNTWFQLGSANEDDDEKKEAWEQSVKQYDGALRLNPDDKDAEYNRALVKKKLELLKKQMEQQESQEGKEDPNQKPQPGQKGKKKKGKQKGQEGGSDPSNEPGEKEKDSKKGRDKKGDKKEEGAGDKEKKEKEGGKKDKGEQKDDGKGEQGEQTEAEMQAAMAMGQMTMQQAKQLLDTQKGEERALIFKPTDVKARPRTFKDW